MQRGLAVVVLSILLGALLARPPLARADAPDAGPDELPALLLAGRYDDALLYARRAAAARPNDGDAHLDLASVLELTERYGEGLAEAKRAVDLLPQSADAWFQLAALQHKLGDEPGCHASLDKALAIDPQHEDARTLQDELEIAAQRRNADGGEPAKAERDAARDPAKERPATSSDPLGYLLGGAAAVVIAATFLAFTHRRRRRRA